MEHGVAVPPHLHLAPHQRLAAVVVRVQRGCERVRVPHTCARVTEARVGSARGGDGPRCVWIGNDLHRGDHQEPQGGLNVALTAAHHRDQPAAHAPILEQPDQRTPHLLVFVFWYFWPEVMRCCTRSVIASTLRPGLDPTAEAPD